MDNRKENRLSRRSFLSRTPAAATGITAFSIFTSQQAFASKANSMVQMGIIGTGGRGRHDGKNLVGTERVKIAALADYFDFQMEEPGEEFGVSKDKRFSGTDGYKQLLALDEIDGVLLTTTPYFRPIQFKAAIEAGKHVFAEKPIAVDPWGCRTFLAAGKKAAKKNLTVGAGLQTRYEEGHQQIAKMIQDGAIGKLLLGHSTRMGSDLWRRKRPAHFTERDHQVRHWLYYQWGSGDFITEMHIHNLDVFNWFTGMLPVSAVGKGGRNVRLDVGDIYDYIQVLFEYPDDFSLSHTGTQINAGYQGSVKQIVGTKGYYDQSKGLVIEKGKPIKHEGIRNATREEMMQFVASVLGEIPTINNSDYVTTSTFTCILGRTAAYSGKKVTWDRLWKSNKRYKLPST